MPETQEYICQSHFAAKDRTELHKPGDTVTHDYLKSFSDPAWLIKTGAIAPKGPKQRAYLSLLPDDPTPEQYVEEILRLQLIVEEMDAKIEDLQRQVADAGRAADVKFPAKDAGVAADNAGRKMREMEARLAQAEERADREEKRAAGWEEIAADWKAKAEAKKG
jgi:hypothetical protein